MRIKCSYCSATIDSDSEACPSCHSKRVPWRHPAHISVPRNAPKSPQWFKLGGAFLGGVVLAAGLMIYLLGGARSTVASAASHSTGKAKPVSANTAVRQAQAAFGFQEPRLAEPPEWVILKTPENLPRKTLSGAELYEAARKSVVVIRAGDSLGSGFVIKGRRIITNVHVINQTTRVMVKDATGRMFAIHTILALQGARDVAILRLPDGIDIPALEIAPRPKIGDPVYAIGAPHGLEYTVTSGLVSQIRAIGDQVILIQTDASISPGSSGGPLLNAEGRVVGIATLASRAIVDANNLNFAVSIEDVKKTMAEEQPFDIDGRMIYSESHLDPSSAFATGGDAETEDEDDQSGVKVESAPVVPREAAEDTLRVEDPTQTLALEVPRAWTPLRRGLAVAGAVSPSEGANDPFRENVTVYSFAGETADMDSFYHGRYREMGHLRGAVNGEAAGALKSMDRMTISGCEARRLVYSNDTNGTFVIEYLIRTSHGYFSVLMQVRNSDYGRWKEKLRQIGETIRVSE